MDIDYKPYFHDLHFPSLPSVHCGDYADLLQQIEVSRALHYLSDQTDEVNVSSKAKRSPASSRRIPTVLNQAFSTLCPSARDLLFFVYTFETQSATVLPTTTAEEIHSNILLSQVLKGKPRYSDELATLYHLRTTSHPTSFPVFDYKQVLPLKDALNKSITKLTPKYLSQSLLPLLAEISLNRTGLQKRTTVFPVSTASIVYLNPLICDSLPEIEPADYVSINNVYFVRICLAHKNGIKCLSKRTTASKEERSSLGCEFDPILFTKVYHPGERWPTNHADCTTTAPNPVVPIFYTQATRNICYPFTSPLTAAQTAEHLYINPSLPIVETYAKAHSQNEQESALILSKTRSDLHSALETDSVPTDIISSILKHAPTTSTPTQPVRKGSYEAEGTPLPDDSRLNTTSQQSSENSTIPADFFTTSIPDVPSKLLISMYMDLATLEWTKICSSNHNEYDSLSSALTLAKRLNVFAFVSNAYLSNYLTNTVSLSQDCFRNLSHNEELDFLETYVMTCPNLDSSSRMLVLAKLVETSIRMMNHSEDSCYQTTLLL